MSLEKFKKGNIKDLNKISLLYEKCKKDLLSKNILQWGAWNDNYPDIKHLRKAILLEELFILSSNNDIFGVTILNGKKSDKWKTIPWDKTKMNALIIHAFVIDPQHQNRGFGEKLLSYCEQYARDNKYESMRLDAFTKNDQANKFYQKFKYVKVGTVVFDQKPKGNMEYHCYEKLL